MVGTQFAEQHVEGDGLGALLGQFLDQPAINFARPVKAEMKTDFCDLSADVSFFTALMLDSSMATKARLVAAGAGKCSAVRARKS